MSKCLIEIKRLATCTDISARSFSDVDDVKFVINYDYPSCSEDYVHRIGRTGRSNNTGTAYTFFTPDNCVKAKDLIQVNKYYDAKLYLPSYSIIVKMSTI